MKLLLASLFLCVTTVLAGSLELGVDFSKSDGVWDLPALGLGQGGLQSDPILTPHIKELRQLRSRTIRLFLSEYYRVYPAHGVFDFTRIDRELEAIAATGARPTLALAMKPPILFPAVDHFKVHPNRYEEWEALCQALAKHCLDRGFRVAAWEVCNEPDIGETGGTPQFFTKAEDYNTFYDHTIAGLLKGDPGARVGGPAVASADSFLIDGLLKHCAEAAVPLHFLSWHLYSDSPAAHANNIERQRARLARYPQLKDTKLFVSEWNMDLMRPNLHPGYQPAFILETMRRFADERLDMAAYYHIRDCFVDPADFDWMSPGGVNFMAHWWNTMPQYSALFDHHGRVRPAWYAFRLLGQFEGRRFAVSGEQGGIHAIAAQREHRKHILIWRFEGGDPPEVEVQVRLHGQGNGAFRLVALEAGAPVNNLQVERFGRIAELEAKPLAIRLKPWDVRWIEIE